MIKCIIIDDEPLAIKKIESFIAKYPSTLHLLASFTSGIDAIDYIKNTDIDLVFLDIQMKELIGIQLLESININAKVIITSAYEQYAIKGFDLQVSDYLLKPISFERFAKAIDRVTGEIRANQQDNKQQELLIDKIFFKTEYRLEGIRTTDILYIEGLGDYRKIVTPSKNIITLQTFAEIIAMLPVEKFSRVHNSYIVGIAHIEK